MRWHLQFPSLMNLSCASCDAVLNLAIYTTNAIESMNAQLRKVTRKRGAFPTVFGLVGEVVSSLATETGSQPSSARVYRPRRPAKTLLHQITRENLETYLADSDPGEDFSSHVPLHVEAAFREYLKCGLLCHGLVASIADDRRLRRRWRQGLLRWLHRHGHLDDMAVHSMDSADHAGGWSVNASVTIPEWKGGY